MQYKRFSLLLILLQFHTIHVHGVKAVGSRWIDSVYSLCFAVRSQPHTHTEDTRETKRSPGWTLVRAWTRVNVSFAILQYVIFCFLIVTTLRQMQKENEKCLSCAVNTQSGMNGHRRGDGDLVRYVNKEEPRVRAKCWICIWCCWWDYIGANDI